MEKPDRISLLVLTVIVFVSMLALRGRAQESQAGMSASGTPRVIAITAKRFAFAPAEITLKKGEAVTFQLTTDDVTHGFFLRPLKIDQDIEPGKTTSVTVTPDKAGKFTLICDHFCGANHGSMHMVVNVVE
jgi:cytochrome c oxidase subunit 2